jgi:hypothetical protein
MVFNFVPTWLKIIVLEEATSTVMKHWLYFLTLKYKLNIDSNLRKQFRTVGLGLKNKRVSCNKFCL